MNKKPHTTIWSFFIDKMKVTWLLIAALLVMGVFSALTLPRESAIDIQIPVGIVSTFSEASEPGDMEELITDVIEQEVAELDGIKQISSTSSRSFSSITVEFNADEDIDDSIRALRDKVNEAKALLPGDAEDPQVTGISFSDQAVLTFSLAGDYSLEYLSEISDDIADEIKRVSGVSKVEVSGALEKAYTVSLNKEKIEGLGLSIADISNKIRAANTGFPLGNTDLDSFEYGVRLDSRITSIEDLKSIAIQATEDKGFLLLQDIATITEGYKDRDVISKVAHFKEDGLQINNTVTYNIYKSDSASIVTVVKKVKEKILNEQNSILPEGVSYVEVLNMADFVNEDLQILSTSAFQTIGLIILFLLIFLGVRESLIAATSIPISFFIVFIYMNFIGMKLNGMVLFSLVIGLGLLVDTAIVITEGLHENIVRKKMDIREGAILAIKQYNKPLLSGTLTTIFAFVPMFLVSGIMGEYLKVIPTILIILLSASYFVALFLVPAVGARFIQPKHPEKVHYNDKFDKYMHKKLKIYTGLMNTILASKAKRRLVIFGSMGLFILSLGLPFSGALKVSMFPDSDFDYFEISVELPTGSSLEETKAIVQQIQGRLAEEEVISHFVETIGAQTTLMSDGGRSSSSQSANLGHFTVHLIDESEREKSYKVSQRIDEKLQDIQGAEIATSHPQGGPPSGSPIEIRLLSDEIENVSVAAENMEQFLLSIPGVTSTSTSVERGAGEFLIIPKKELLNLYNISLSELATTVRASLDTFEIEELLVNGDEISLELELDQIINSPAELRQIPIGPQGVLLSDVADIRLTSNISSIQHRDQKRYAFVRADLAPGYNANEVTNIVKKRIGEIDLKNATVSYGGEVEDIAQSLNDLFTSMIVGIILISLVLVIQFNSYKQPLMVISMIPIALIGVFLGFTLINFALSFLAFIGVVGLAGIVVNDAIILVDKVNIARDSGKSIPQAAIEGGAARMQPIFLTSLTTIFGMIPLIFVNEIWRDFALAIIFGLIISTLFALFLVPTLYAHYERE